MLGYFMRGMVSCKNGTGLSQTLFKVEKNHYTCHLDCEKETAVQNSSSYIEEDDLHQILSLMLYAVWIPVHLYDSRIILFSITRI